MAVSIATYNSEQDLVLGNNSANRTLGIGTTWTSLRIGARWRIEDIGSSGPGLWVFGLGMQAGVTTGFYNSPALWTGNILAANDHFVRHTGTPVSFDGQYQNLSKKIGVAETAGSAKTWYVSADSAYHTATLVQIDKLGGGALYLKGYHCGTSIAVGFDISKAQLEAAALDSNDLATTNSLASISSGYIPAFTYNPTGIAQPLIDNLDSISILWKSDAFQAIVEDVIVVADGGWSV